MGSAPRFPDSGASAPLLSICIPTFNRIQWLQRCLDRCIAQAEALDAGLVEVVVSDNAGTDGSWEMLQERAERHPCLRIHRNAENVWAENFNVVVGEARGGHVWLMGDDDAPVPGALAKVVELIRDTPRDLYLLHCVEVDTDENPIAQRQWFKDLPTLDWDLSDRASLIDYLNHAQYLAGVFGFISVLVFDRLAWLAAAPDARESEAYAWPHVGRALKMIRTRGLVRVVEEALLLNTAGNDSYEEKDPWARAMWDLGGWLRLGVVYFPVDRELRRAFLGPLRRNRQAYLLHHLWHFAPSRKDWEKARQHLIWAEVPTVDIAAYELAGGMLEAGYRPPLQLDAENLCLADLGFIVRGSRRVLILTARTAGPELAWLLGALGAQTRAEIKVLGGPGFQAPAEVDGQRITCSEVDLVRVAGDAGYQQELGDALRAFAPDLVLNVDPERRPSWDILALAAGGVAGLAFKAPERQIPAELAAWLDSGYTRLLPAGPMAALAAAMGLALPAAPEPGPAPAAAPAPSSPIPAPPIPAPTKLKLNLGCGLEHLPGWVNVDQFPGSHPDLVHDLETFPWPFQDDCAAEVLLKHVLEHLGRDSATFLEIMKELYRVCAPGARVRILVPHPRHQDFLQDPTHVRPVLAELFEHFSLSVNEDWGRRGLPGTPLARYLGVDFQIESATLNLDPWWDAEFRSGRISREQLDRAMRDCNNVVQTTEIMLRVRKSLRSVAAPVLVQAAAAGPAKAPVALRWEGSQFVYHSLAHVNRQLCLGLLQSGRVELSLLSYEPDQFAGAAVPAFRALAKRTGKALSGPAKVHVRHQWPPKFDPPPQGAWVMIQPWEYGGIPAEWVAPMRDRVDEIWVPSSWLKDCYVRSGIPADKVVVVPNGVDAEVFRPEGERLPLKSAKACKFLFLGGTIHRKGIDLLLDTYVRTFRSTDDVCLVIKEQGSGVYGTPGLPEFLGKLRADDPLAPEIEYLTGSLTQPQIAALYRACDVLVAPYRGEGFGLPIAEAMASALPVIVTARGGAQDFVREDWAYLIPSHAVPAGNPEGLTPSRAGFWLEEPDGEVLAGHLRRAYASPGERRAMGLKGRAFAVAELGWDKPVARVLERLEALAERSPRRDAPPEAPLAGPEAFLYVPDWSGSGWVEVLLSYLLAFKAGDPVALILPRAGTPGEQTLAQLQVRVLECVRGAGLQAFPDVVLVDQPAELPEVLAGYEVVTRVAPGRGSVAGLVGVNGIRLAEARTRLCQGAAPA